MRPSFATETIRIYYPEVISARGTIELRYKIDPLDSIAVSGCSVQPTTTSENLNEPRTESMTLLTAWIPDAEWARVVAGGDIRKLAFEWRGMLLAQYGQALPWVSPTGALGHVQVYLRQYEG
jgi:hypothetical protein